jgi:16S rRNA pseudouridine516 synthase
MEHVTTMKLAKYLANLGYGTRTETARLIGQGRVTHAQGEQLREGDAFTHSDVRLDGEPLDPEAGSLIMMHKPVGYVCSTNDVPPLVYELLPERFARRTPVVATVGRLDRDTSGLLLLTDDGALNHRLTSPRSHVPKTYEAVLAQPLRGHEVELFASGTLMLESERTSLQPATLELIDDRRIRLTIQEGRYHQVRRMFAAVGNHVDELRRVAIGSLQLGHLESGSWRVVSDTERQLLTSSRPVP